MARFKIDYGIDLGTTNSAIARCDNGIVKIIKSSRDQKDTTPSCVHINKKKQIKTGDFAYSKLFLIYDINRTFLEFKRTMGTGTLYPKDYPNEYNSDIEKRFNSEELSSEILKTLKNYVTDDKFNSVVITVPARFERTQCDATIRAANLAGFDYVELLLEPIAASTAFAVDSKFSDGYWLVYDFGGGTFDSVLMCSTDGIMNIVSTAGDTHLGGKDFDEVLRDSIILNKLKKDYKINNLLNSKSANSFLTALKRYSELAKISLSSTDNGSTNLIDDLIELEFEDDNGKPIHLDYEILLCDYEKLIRDMIQRSIDISLTLLKEHNVDRRDLKTVLMVGGPTYTPLMRRMVKEQISDNINISIDPMTVVAKGAAIYASTRDIPLINQTRDLTKVQLRLNYPSNAIEKDVLLSYEIRNYNSKFNKYSIQVIRCDDGFDSGKNIIDQDKGIIELELRENQNNIFNINIYDEYGTKVECEPNSFTIYQGTIIALQVTANDFGIGIEVINDEGVPELLFESLIPKNSKLPAIGKGKFKTKEEVKPGNVNDRIWIPILEGKNGTKFIRNKTAKNYFKYGNCEQISRVIPAGTDVEIEMKIDSSLKVELTMYIPFLDETFSFNEEDETPNVYDDPMENIMKNELANAYERINQLMEHSFSNYKLDFNKLESLKKDADEINKLANSNRNDTDRKIQIKDRVNNLQNELDYIYKKVKHLIIRDNITQALYHAKQLQERYGDLETQKELDILLKQFDDFKDNKNIKFGKQVLDNIYTFNFKILNDRIEFWVSNILETEKDFNMISWKTNSQNQAKQIIANGKSIIASEPSVDSLKNIMIKLWNLMEDGKNKNPYPEGALTK